MTADEPRAADLLSPGVDAQRVPWQAWWQVDRGDDGTVRRVERNTYSPARARMALWVFTSNGQTVTATEHRHLPGGRTGTVTVYHFTIADGWPVDDLAKLIGPADAGELVREFTFVMS